MLSPNVEGDPLESHPPKSALLSLSSHCKARTISCTFLPLAGSRHFEHSRDDGIARLSPPDDSTPSSGIGAVQVGSRWINFDRISDEAARQLRPLDVRVDALRRCLSVLSFRRRCRLELVEGVFAIFCEAGARDTARLRVTLRG